MPLTILPVAGQSLNVTRDPIRNNFQLIQNAFGGIADHIDLGIADQGKHAKVTLPVQAIAPAFIAGEEGLYNLNIVGIGNELFVHKQINGGTNDIPFTQSILSTNATPTTGTQAYTYLPSGIILAWGSWNSGVLSKVTLTRPMPNMILSVILTPYFGNSAAATVNATVSWLSNPATTNSTFDVWTTINGATAPVIFSFLAIGF
jgi:hypothetical protein